MRAVGRRSQPYAKTRRKHRCRPRRPFRRLRQCSSCLQCRGRTQPALQERQQQETGLRSAHDDDVHHDPDYDSDNHDDATHDDHDRDHHDDNADDDNRTACI
jgi:hypothetical protein